MSCGLPSHVALWASPDPAFALAGPLPATRHEAEVGEQPLVAGSGRRRRVGVTSTRHRDSHS
jgi:hypothetical protein